MKGLRYGVLMLLSVASSSIAADQKRVEQIAVFNRFTSTICGGLCVDQIVSVSSDGSVHWQLRNPRTSELMGRQAHFSVGRAAAAKFIQTMDTIRPRKDIVTQSGCNRRYHVPKVLDWNINWAGEDFSVRLGSCDRDGHIRSAWQAAIKNLGMPNGIVGPFESNVVDYAAD